MTGLDQIIAGARRRLWLNRWITQLGWTLAGAAALWLLVLLVDRLFALSLPLGTTAAGLAGLAFLGSVAWLLITRESRLAAAMALDVSADLKERISSSLACADQNDAFVRAVVADAATAASRIRVGQFLPIRAPRSFVHAGLAAGVALLAAWLMPTWDLLGRAQALEQVRARRAAVQDIRTELAKPVEALRSLAEAHPDLKDAGLKDLEQLARQQDAPYDPADLRREAIKKLEKLGDALQDKADRDRYADLKDVRRTLSELDTGSDPKSSVGRLTQALSAGDFHAAQQELKKLQDELARRRHDSSRAQDAQRLAKQLDDLADRLEQASSPHQLDKEMNRLGLSPEQQKRILEALAKKDPRQLEKTMKELSERLRKQGLSTEQIKKLAQKIKQQQRGRGPSQTCNKLAKQLQSAAASCRNSNSSSAGSQLNEMAEQISELELVQQQLGEIESKLADVDNLKESLGESSQEDGPCDACNGTGFLRDGSPCPKCSGRGSCSNRGRGFGKRPKGSGDVAFESHRAKVKQRSGQVIGQWFVKGDQIKGDAKAAYLEATQSAVRNATDAVEQDQVPRAYQGAVKAYFDRLAEPGPPSDRPAQSKSNP